MSPHSRPGAERKADESGPGFIELSEPVLEGLLRKLDWALRQEPVERAGKLAFYRVDRRLLEAAQDLIRETAERHQKSYREHMHPKGPPGE